MVTFPKTDAVWFYLIMRLRLHCTKAQYHSYSATIYAIVFLKINNYIKDCIKDRMEENYPNGQQVDQIFENVQSPESTKY